ncbi:MAG: phosphate acetyltransferase [Microbacter sp.]
MKLLETIMQRAQMNPQHIVLPEGNEPRTLQAADVILKMKAAQITLIGNPDEIHAMAKEHGLHHIGEASILNPEQYPNMEKYAQLLFEIRQNKGMTLEQAHVLVKDPLYIATLMIKNGDADGEVAGARNTTGNVLRPALQIIKTKPGVSVVSGAVLLFTESPYGENGFVMMADLAVTPNPTAAELAEIAVMTGHTARTLGGFEPRIAMLSFSTKGSAKHELVDKVVEATRLAQAMAPDMQIDGELQADAALVPSVAAGKAPGSTVAGHANVLIMPDIQAGNIGYKLVQRLGNAQAIGPVLQGIAAPINDLSRGCSVDDIVQMIAITVNQAISVKNNVDGIIH